MTRAIKPNRRQTEAASAIVAWYFAHHFGRSDDAGVTKMFCDPARVGAFAVDPMKLAAGDGAALFQLLITTAMFQRRQDVQILRILRGIRPADAREISGARRLLKLVDESPCAHVSKNESLMNVCDLAKEPLTRVGCCAQNASVDCHLKRHTVLLKRYGHFGKVPTSIALLLREVGVRDLPALRQAVFSQVSDPLERARKLETVLSGAWRVNQKIASMYLSMLTNPDLSPGMAPWTDGIDWTYYVVVDSNVDLFLASVGYRGGKTYDDRREFVREIARRIDLREMNPHVASFNPRIVQQALYLFMSAANRRASSDDCMHIGRDACRECPSMLARRCSVRTSNGAAAS